MWFHGNLCPVTACHFNDYICLLLLFFPFSVGEQDDIEGLALETDCLPRYVAKGIALGCFVYARCLHHGCGVEQNGEQAREWYSRVSTDRGLTGDP